MKNILKRGTDHSCTGLVYLKLIQPNTDSSLMEEFEKNFIIPFRTELKQY